MITVVGLGNPGEEYAKTRHNAGRIILESLAREHGFSDWRDDTKTHARICKGNISALTMQFVLPDNYMNNSGGSVKPFVKEESDLEKVVVVYDDIDLPVGTMKVSFDRGTGGHNGLGSIMQVLGTGAFLRVRVGICPVTPEGEMNKPKGEGATADFVLKNFKSAEIEALASVTEKVRDALVVYAKEGKERVMNVFN